MHTKKIFLLSFSFILLVIFISCLMTYKNEKKDFQREIDIYNKLIIRKDYEKKMSDLQDYYLTCKKILNKKNDYLALKQLEAEYQNELKTIKEIYSKKFGEKMYG